MSRDGFEEFAEKAWPKITGGEATGSGLVRPQTTGHSDTGPTAAQIEEERKIYPEYPQNLGGKPEESEDPLELETLKKMTLKEHMIHVKWYDSAKSFKAKIHPGVSEQFWKELVEIFKMYHIYNVCRPESCLAHLKTKWALEYYGLIYGFLMFC